MKKLILIILPIVFLSACNKMVIKKPIETSYENKYVNKYSVPIRYDRTSINLPKGALIGKYMANFDCKGPYRDIYWNEARDLYKDVNFEDVFFEELSLKNYNVIGDPNKVYGGDYAKNKAKYKIGAQITGIRTNLCNNINFLFDWEEGVSGQMEIYVLWEVYSIGKQEVVLEVKTKGYYNLEKANPEGFDILLTESFASAVEELANNDKFQKLIFTRNEKEVVKNYEKWPFTPLVLKEIPVFKDPIKSNIDYIRGSTVLIRTGLGHGSGFFISSDGYILTNYHVVGDSEEIFIEDEFGRKMVAEIIRVHKGRDIALLKLKGDPIKDIKALPIRKIQASIGEDVYAVGSPLDEIYQNTITKGIVSSWKELDDYSHPLIQSDVDIQKGNSGGPLLDSNGNVVAVAVAGIGELSIGMNFFIPISDALNKLNITFK
jgi:S1-C subfamily serine protease